MDPAAEHTTAHRHEDDRRDEQHLPASKSVREAAASDCCNGGANQNRADRKPLLECGKAESLLNKN